MSGEQNGDYRTFFVDALAEHEDDLPAEVDGVDVHGAYAALGMLTCPWRLRTGTCVTGCESEPACETCEPDDGWAAELRRASGA